MLIRNTYSDNMEATLPKPNSVLMKSKDHMHFTTFKLNLHPTFLSCTLALLQSCQEQLAIQFTTTHNR